MKVLAGGALEDAAELAGLVQASDLVGLGSEGGSRQVAPLVRATVSSAWRATRSSGCGSRRADGADGAGWHADATTVEAGIHPTLKVPIPEPTSGGARVEMFEDGAEEVGEVVAKLIWERWRIEPRF